MLKQYKLKNYKFTLIFLVAALTILGILLMCRKNRFSDLRLDL